ARRMPAGRSGKPAMPDTILDAEGRLLLPPEVREALGWTPGQAIHLQAEGDQLLAQSATRATSLKDEARRLAAAMKDLARGAARQAAEAVSTLAEPGEARGGGRQVPFHGTGP